jgi:hypothetical protein
MHGFEDAITSPFLETRIKCDSRRDPVMDDILRLDDIWAMQQPQFVYTHAMSPLTGFSLLLFRDVILGERNVYWRSTTKHSPECIRRSAHGSGGPSRGKCARPPQACSLDRHLLSPAESRQDAPDQMHHCRTRMASTANVVSSELRPLRADSGPKGALQYRPPCRGIPLWFDNGASGKHKESGTYGTCPRRGDTLTTRSR